ncbi:glycoside hydrolase family 127 protein [Streptomyces pathocidini]|uniref:Glycoside hydrolase family 127 protein n=1 Tax=Streptomyces pathocidini TaxID=1650571 RepID=A0ABW7UJ61_9ACTN|nr:beta-L-arabinofuranosidase domain-containing protein [Streptomyces pathocidini]
MAMHPAPARPALSGGPLALTKESRTALRPVPEARITGGLWEARRAVNAGVSIPDGYERLAEAGNLHDLRLAAGTAEGEYANAGCPFMDSDVYKWLEAVAWQLGDPATEPERAERFAAQVAEVAELLAEAQEPDGYLDSYYQVVRPGSRFKELASGHELYCAGHLVQAAVAHHRTTGRTELLDVARRFADRIDAAFGQEEGRIDGVCGHPEIETALVELYRCTGERRYLERARYFIDRRGHGLLPGGRWGRSYWQDHAPVREAEAVAGHAVRQLYLLAGVVDVSVETGDASLLEAAERLWEEMAATKTYLTGGIGSHHSGETFGDPYELPSERAYTETCAAIASAMLSWRLLLATGRARYADHLERVLFNGFLSGVSLDGERYLYINPLQVREGHLRDEGDHTAFRTRWFRCACCPPNVMRLLASLPHYFAAAEADGLVLHQYATGSYAADGFGVEVATDYPWNGRIRVTVTEAPGADRALALRIPQWAAGRWTASAAGEEVDREAVADGWLRLRRTWRPGDTVVLDLDLAPRLTAGPVQADAVRGCAAIERGPLVYCVERVDQPDGIRLDELRLDPAGPLGEGEGPGLPSGVVAVTATGRVAAAPDGGWWPYGEVATASDAGAAETGGPGAGAPAGSVELIAVPYHLWAHREEGPMRVWIPLAGTGV